MSWRVALTMPTKWGYHRSRWRASPGRAGRLLADAVLLLAVLLVPRAFRGHQAQAAGPAWQGPLPRPRREALGAALTAASAAAPAAWADDPLRREMVPLFAMPALMGQNRAPQAQSPPAAAPGSPPPAGLQPQASSGASTSTSFGPPLRPVGVPPTGEFRISLPTTWETQLDQYPGRLVTSYDPRMSAVDLTAVRVGRLSLPALLRSAQYNPREGDDKRGKWEEVALGGITPGGVAVWIMDAGQAAAAKSAGIGSMLFNYNVTESRIEPLADAKPSTLIWRATSTINPASNLPAQFTQQVPGPRVTYGKAVLRGGMVTFALTQAFETTKYDPAYLEGITQSLELARGGTF